MKKIVIRALLILALVILILLSLVVRAKSEGEPAETPVVETVTPYTENALSYTEMPVMETKTETPVTEPVIQDVEPEPVNVFDSAVFVGDSITVGLRNYVKGSEAFNSVQFSAKTGCSISYGKKLLNKCEAENVYIMLGINDMKSGAKTILKNYTALIAVAEKKYTAEHIYIISILPMTARRETSKMNNEKIDEVNARIREYAEQRGIMFLDIAPALKNENNDGDPKYYRDNYVHLSKAGYALFVSEIMAAFVPKEPAITPELDFGAEVYAERIYTPLTDEALFKRFFPGENLEENIYACANAWRGESGRDNLYVKYDANRYGVIEVILNRAVKGHRGDSPRECASARKQFAYKKSRKVSATNKRTISPEMIEEVRTIFHYWLLELAGLGGSEWRVLPSEKYMYFVGSNQLNHFGDDWPLDNSTKVVTPKQSEFWDKEMEALQDVA